MKKGFDMKIIKQTIALSILSVTLTFASINNNTHYSMMSTVELEKEVENLSISGALPFEMGMELIKRWETPELSHIPWKLNSVLYSSMRRYSFLDKCTCLR